MLQGHASTPTRIFSTRDHIGEIHVDQEGTRRILRFGDDTSQSEIDLRQPTYPSHSYVRAMACAGLMPTAPQRVAILGHGGGALTKFYIDAMPSVRKDVVDLRGDVLYPISMEFFGLELDGNTALHTGDARAYLKHFARLGAQFDVLNTDIFIDGPSDIIETAEYWRSVKAALSPVGLSCTNVWNGGHFTRKYEIVRAHHHNTFRHVFEIPCSSAQVAMCGTDLDPTLLLMRAHERARQLPLFDASPYLATTRILN